MIMKMKEKRTKDRIREILQYHDTQIVMAHLETENIPLLQSLLANETEHQWMHDLANYLCGQVEAGLVLQLNLQTMNPKMSFQERLEVTTKEVYAPQVNHQKKNLQLTPLQEGQLRTFKEIYEI